MTLSWVHLRPDHWVRAEPSRPEVARRFVHAAGVTILDQGLDVLVRGIDVERAVERSGRSRRAFYDTFRDRRPRRVAGAPSCNNEDEQGGNDHVARRRLVTQLVHETCDPRRSFSTSELGAQMVSIVAPAAASGDVSFEEAIRRYATDQYREVLDDDIHRLQSLVWALGQHDDDVCDAFRTLYAAWGETVAGGVVAVLEGCGRRLRPPLTSELVATSMTALIEGLATRARVDPAAVPNELFGELVIGLLHGLSEPAV